MTGWTTASAACLMTFSTALGYKIIDRCPAFDLGDLRVRPFGHEPLSRACPVVMAA
jgi:hypothetical protein